MSHPTETPLRIMVAVAPSGGEIRFIKYQESLSPSLSFYRNILTAEEDRIWWSAKLAAEKPGVEQWEKARALLVAHGFVVLAEARETDAQ